MGDPVGVIIPSLKQSKLVQILFSRLHSRRIVNTFLELFFVVRQAQSHPPSAVFLGSHLHRRKLHHIPVKFQRHL
jgi:hypothetical protein